MTDLLEKLGQALAPYSPKRKYLVGVSGGRDSMALLSGLHSLGYKKLVVCHLNHRLRGTAADDDASLVATAAKKFRYRFDLREADVQAHAASQKLSIETAARHLRYAFFGSCAQAHRCKRIFLAHHADDQIETCLFNFLRGSGAAGLAGMKPLGHAHGLEILRPMLGISRREITAFVNDQAIGYCDDLSNASIAHTRNRLRSLVIPAIEHAFGNSFHCAILRTAEILREEESWMASLVPEVEKTLSCKMLRQMAPALQRRVVLRWLREADVPEPGFAETSLVLSLLDAKTGPAKVNLPGNCHARRREGKLFLEKAEGSQKVDRAHGVASP
ncbi:MAG TPA: tRNA lysidine(34) synthetase TilS [Terrimicrobiaceae bacterium]